MSLLYFLERAKLCQLLLKSQMPSESPIEPIMLNKFLYNIEYSSKTLKENANRLQKKTRRNIQFNTFFSSERKSLDCYTNCCISYDIFSSFFQGRVQEAFHQENLDSERIALTQNTRTTIIAREMLENLHTFHRHPYRQVALNY